MVGNIQGQTIFTRPVNRVLPFVFRDYHQVVLLQRQLLLRALTCPPSYLVHSGGRKHRLYSLSYSDELSVKLN